MDFLGSSAGKEATCNAGDLDSIPGSRRSPGEGMGYPLQYSWAFLVAQMVKKPPARWETFAQSLGWEDPLEEAMATPSSILAWRIPWTEKPGGLQSTGSQRVGHDWVTKHTAQHRYRRETMNEGLWIIRGQTSWSNSHREADFETPGEGAQRNMSYRGEEVSGRGCYTWGSKAGELLLWKQEKARVWETQRR